MVSYPQDGYTALHSASQEGHVDVVRVLIDANAHVNQQTTVLNVSIAKLAVFICSNRLCPHTVSVYPSSVHSCSIPFASLPALLPLLFFPSIHSLHCLTILPLYLLKFSHPFHPTHPLSLPPALPPSLPPCLQ